MTRTVMAAVAMVALSSCGEAGEVNESEMRAIQDAKRNAAQPDVRVSHTWEPSPEDLEELRNAEGNAAAGSEKPE